MQGRGWLDRAHQCLLDRAAELLMVDSQLGSKPCGSSTNFAATPLSNSA
jgi:hypothetical protein